MGAKTMGSQGGGGVQPHTLSREGSLYSLTLHEVENHLGNLEKPLSSMNLDELLKTVWSAEAGQGMGLGVGKQPGELGSSSSVRWQPNLVVSRDLSSKTVDEVWRSIQRRRRRHDPVRKDQDRQPTLGEMTLEDFLAKAGIENRPGRETFDNLFGDEQHGEFPQQPCWAQYQLSLAEQTHPLAQSVPGFMSSHSHGHAHLQRPMMDLSAAYPETQLAVAMSPTRGTLSDTQTLGRKRVAPGEMVEKTVERRQKRMIKNRESAARSRARKQAYTNELENKISHLEEEIERLKKQQAVDKEIQCAPPPEPKSQLRRTSSGPP